MTFLAVVSFLIWCYLLTMHGQFWRGGPILPVTSPRRSPPGSAAPEDAASIATPMVAFPAVAIVVPARDEAPVIERTIRSLLAQDYPGEFHVTLVDDNSTDGTGAIGHAIAAAMGGERLSVVTGAPRPAGWAGKLWALQQGITFSAAARYYLLTDADVEHDSKHLSSLVAAAERYDLDMASEMVALSCDNWAEKAFVPAFVFFFQLLYPFAWVNNPLCSTAAAAGGTVLISRRALNRIGGIEAVRGALIDDVALAGAVKTGGRIYLGHSALARSVRPYAGVSDIWRMIARSAYAQLRFSRVLLAGTTVAMAVVWLVPPFVVIFGHGIGRVLGLVTWGMFAATYLPTLIRFRRSYVWALFLPAIALFYMTATIGSAVNHHRGRGVVWKGRAYAGGTP